MSLSVGSAAPTLTAGSSAAVIATNAVHVLPKVIISTSSSVQNDHVQGNGHPLSLARRSLHTDGFDLDLSSRADGGRVNGQAPEAIGAKSARHHRRLRGRARGGSSHDL